MISVSVEIVTDTHLSWLRPLTGAGLDCGPETYQRFPSDISSQLKDPAQCYKTGVIRQC